MSQRNFLKAQRSQTAGRLYVDQGQKRVLAQAGEGRLATMKQRVYLDALREEAGLDPIPHDEHMTTRQAAAQIKKAMQVIETLKSLG